MSPVCVAIQFENCLKGLIHMQYYVRVGNTLAGVLMDSTLRLAMKSYVATSTKGGGKSGAEYVSKTGNSTKTSAVP